MRGKALWPEGSCDCGRAHRLPPLAEGDVNARRQLQRLSSERGMAAMPFGRSLVGPAGAHQQGFAKMRRDDLEGHRRTAGRAPPLAA